MISDPGPEMDRSIGAARERECHRPRIAGLSGIRTGPSAGSHVKTQRDSEIARRNEEIKRHLGDEEPSENVTLVICE